jgi:hypothetical protein
MKVRYCTLFCQSLNSWLYYSQLPRFYVQQYTISEAFKHANRAVKYLNLFKRFHAYFLLIESGLI